MAALVPGMPLSLTKLSASQTSISVSWSAPSSDGGSPVLSYNVYGNGGGSSTSFTIIGTTTSTSFTQSSLSPPGQTFVYRVTAVNAAGEGTPSASTSVILATVPSTPTSPTL